MTVEDEARDGTSERRDAVAEPAPSEATVPDDEEDDVVDAHIWRAQT